MVEFENPQLEQLFNKVKNKHRKFNILTSSGSTIGHSLSIGMPGHGKTTGNRKEVEIRVEAAHHKVICLYDAGRMDMAYFMFPSTEDFWKKPKYEGGKIIAARSYKTELIYFNSKNVPDKLPNNSILCTIPVCDLDENDISAMTGFVNTESIKSILGYMENYVNEGTTPEDYVNLMGEALRYTQDIDGIKIPHHSAKKLKYEVFQPLINEGILSSKKVSTAIDIRKILKDRKTISVLVLRHCPQKVWGFLVNYLMNHIYKNLSGVDGSKRIKQNTTIVLNEVADLLQTGGDYGESAFAISSLIGKIAKQGRTANLYLLMDTQIPQQLPEIKDIMNRVYIFNSGVAEIQKAMEIMGYSIRTGMISQDEINLVPFLPRGWYFLLTKTGVLFNKLQYLRSRTYHDGEDFYDIYDKVYGKMAYYSIDKYIEELRQEKLLTKQVWELKRLKNKKKEEVVLDKEESEEEPEDEEIEENEVKIKSPSIKKIKIPKKAKKIKEVNLKVTEKIEKKEELSIINNIEHQENVENKIEETSEQKINEKSENIRSAKDIQKAKDEYKKRILEKYKNKEKIKPDWIKLKKIGEVFS